MSKRRRDAERRLIVGILAALGAGKVTECRLTSKDEYVDGLQVGDHVWVDPCHAVVDTLIHELIHWLRPVWSETTVRGWTTRCISTLSDAEYDAMFEAYKRHARKRKGKKAA